MRIEFLKRRLGHEVLNGRDPETVRRLVRELDERMNVAVRSKAR